MMNATISFLAVLALGFIAYLGVEAAGLHLLFGGIIPYIAFVLLVLGAVFRIVKWAKSPVPFRIPTSCGQQKSLKWIQDSKFDNPSTTWGLFVRMALEVLFFRSLLRNTRVELREEGRLTYGHTKWLWLAALAFHYSFLIVLFRHLRFFTDEVPTLVLWTQNVDGFFEIGVPVFYLTSLILLGAVGYLFIRRIWSDQLRYISLVNDYFPLFLIIGIAATGILLRHFVKTDVVGVKEMALGILHFNPVVAESVHWLFYVHFFLVCVLFAYFPFSKLMHAAGVFFSPARNMVNNTRAVRHVNPWNYPVKVHTYEEYEDDFREKMKAAGIPVDKE